MCVPVAIGIITAVTSALGSIASYSQQKQEVKYQNAVAKQQYQQQTDIYKKSVESTQQQYRLNAESANRAYVAEQNKLRVESQKATQEQQNLLVSSLQAQGTVLASGRSGQSFGLMMTDAERSYGRDLATLGMNLAWAENDYYTSTQSTFLQAQSANNLAASNQMLAPVKPLKMPSPSPIGLVTSLAGAGMAGYGAYSGLKAPSAGGGQARPQAIPNAQLPGGRAGTVITWN